MREDISKNFIKDIDDNAKLYEVINAGGEKIYIIELKEDGEYIETFSCVADEDGEEPELMVEYYLGVASIREFSSVMRNLVKKDCFKEIINNHWDRVDQDIEDVMRSGLARYVNIIDLDHTVSIVSSVVKEKILEIIDGLNEY